MHNFDIWLNVLYDMITKHGSKNEGTAYDLFY